MSKCCFCGLCTTVCPTECLTMTSEYDFSVFEVKDHNFSFANLTAEEAEEKKRLYEQFVAEKEAMKQAGDSGQLAVVSGQSSVVSPESEVQSPEVKKAAFKPSFKPKAVDSGQSSVDSPESEVQSPTSDSSPASTAKPTFKPSFKPKTNVQSPASEVQRPTSDVQRPASNKDNPDAK